MNDVAVGPSTATHRAEAENVLWGFWYPALQSAELRSRLRRTMLLDVPLVVGRDARGEAFALRDVCPHQMLPLSFGRLDGNAIECAYHGWRFDPHTGRCLAIPSLTSDSKVKCERIRAVAFPCAERDGYVYV